MGTSKSVWDTMMEKQRQEMKANGIDAFTGMFSKWSYKDKIKAGFIGRMWSK